MIVIGSRVQRCYLSGIFQDTIRKWLLGDVMFLLDKAISERKRAACALTARETGSDACLCVFDTFLRQQKDKGMIAMMLTWDPNAASEPSIATSSSGEVRDITTR
jgi:hypothetical protein